MLGGAGHEIEIKLAVRDAAGIRRLLNRLSAAGGTRVHEVNAVFDTPEGKLRGRGQLLRLRVERKTATPAIPSGGGASSGGLRRRQKQVQSMLFPPRSQRKALVTVKAPVAGAAHGRFAGGGRPGPSRAAYKVRREIEFLVPDAVAFRAVLGYLGLQPVFFYEKYRTTYRLPGLKDVIVAVDETPIGTYLELEGRPRAIDRARRHLGYRSQDAILDSYGGLYAARQRSLGLPFGHMLFGR